MRLEFNSINDIALFNSLNQWDRKETKNQCTIYGPAINLKYNCWIELTEDDLDIIAEWLGWLPNWGLWIKWVNAVYDYVKEHAKERWWNVPNLATFYNDDPELMDWVERGYMVMIGIKVNKEFLVDARDWKISNHKDYFKYKWNDVAHFTNIYRWICRWEDNCSTYWKESFQDSYAFNKKWRSWTYECDIEEVIEDIAMRSKYIFF